MCSFCSFSYPPEYPLVIPQTLSYLVLLLQQCLVIILDALIVNTIPLLDLQIVKGYCDELDTSTFLL